MKVTLRSINNMTSTLKRTFDLPVISYLPSSSHYPDFQHRLILPGFALYINGIIQYVLLCLTPFAQRYI